MTDSILFYFLNKVHLAMKLEYYGIRGRNLMWMKSFLANWTQNVVFDGNAADTVPVTPGVPQGIVLGPLFILIYINNLQDSVTPVC